LSCEARSFPNVPPSTDSYRSRRSSFIPGGQKSSVRPWRYTNRVRGFPISLPREDLTPEPRNVQGRRFDVTQMPHRKAIFQRTVNDSTVDRPDSPFGELTKGSRPAEAGQHRKVSTPVSGSDFARSTSGSGSQRGPWQRRGHPRNRPRRLAYLWVRERLNFAPSVFTVGGHRVVSR